MWRGRPAIPGRFQAAKLTNKTSVPVLAADSGAMANVTYDMMWQEAMAELNEQVHIEDHTMGIPEGVEPPPPPPQVPILEAYQHYACLYIKYMQIFKRMEECYDAMVHPQKRLDVKQVLELVMIRVVELKHLLVKWNPPNPDVKKGDFPQERNFP